MGSGTVYAEIGSEDLAKGLALDYLNEKMGASIECAFESARPATYLVDAYLKSTSVALGKTVYRARPGQVDVLPMKALPVKPKPSRRIAVLRGILNLGRHTPAEIAMPQPDASHTAARHLVAYTKVLTAQLGAGQPYVPSSRALGTPIWPVRQTFPRDEIFELLRVYRQAEARIIVAEKEERWPDEGLNHPPLKDVRRVRVHLTDIGRLPPRIAYDPDRE